MICYYYEAPTYLFFAPDLPELLYYSHFPTAILALLVGLFVVINNPKKLLNRILFLIALCFAAITLANLVMWTNVDSGLILVAWSIFGPLQAIISVLCIYFIYVFLQKKDVTWKVKATFTVLLLPVYIFATTDLNVSGLDLALCDAFQYEGFAYDLYNSLLGVLAIIWTSVLFIKNYKKAKPEFKKQIKFMALGIESFLALFFIIFYVADYLATLKFVEDSRLELYGFIGMGIFVVMIGILIVRFRIFSVGLVAANALIIALLILVGSQLTFAENTTSLALTILTLIMTTLVGLFLAKSVKKEIKQRSELEILTDHLDKANVRLKKLDKLKSEFVSIASHQLRSPLTSIRGYASMLAEGSFGNLPAKAKEPVDRIAESSRLMALAIEDYLNVSRIESGNMKYNLTEFNLKEEVEKITDDIRPSAVKKGLMILFRSKLNSKGVVNADIGKSVQIIHNLINNSLKYTPKGSITIIMRDDLKDKKVFVDIVDTGIGMSQETIDRVFEKFERADNANSVNVAGTGLGLFVALKMANAMKGSITAASEGDGKGSVFTFELPLVQ